MKVPSKNPPATPIVQLLMSADLDCSPTAAAVGATRCAFWAADGVAPTTSTENENNDMSNRNDAAWDITMVAPSDFWPVRLRSYLLQISTSVRLTLIAP